MTTIGTIGTKRSRKRMAAWAEKSSGQAGRYSRRGQVSKSGFWLLGPTANQPNRFGGELENAKMRSNGIFRAMQNKGRGEKPGPKMKAIRWRDMSECKKRKKSKKSRNVASRLRTATCPARSKRAKSGNQVRTVQVRKQSSATAVSKLQSLRRKGSCLSDRGRKEIGKGNEDSQTARRWEEQAD